MTTSTPELSITGETSESRMKKAIAAIQAGRGILVVDDEDRENEGDLVYSAESLTTHQMALMIRECSGIVCLCLTEEKINALKLPQMVSDNSSRNQTAFTVTIEATQGVTTGVSAADRVRTIQAAIADSAQPEDLSRPGHVFPLRARPGGVLERRGHTEASVDMMVLAGKKPCAVLCELMNPDGTMAKLPEITKFSHAAEMPIIFVADIVKYRGEEPLRKAASPTGDEGEQ